VKPNAKQGEGEKKKKKKKKKKIVILFSSRREGYSHLHHLVHQSTYKPEVFIGVREEKKKKKTSNGRRFRSSS
jgi:hypothetical protein